MDTFLNLMLAILLGISNGISGNDPQRINISPDYAGGYIGYDTKTGKTITATPDYAGGYIITGM